MCTLLSRWSTVNTFGTFILTKTEEPENEYFISSPATAYNLITNCFYFWCNKTSGFCVLVCPSIHLISETTQIPQALHLRYSNNTSVLFWQNCYLKLSQCGKFQWNTMEKIINSSKIYYFFHKTADKDEKKSFLPLSN